MDALLPWERPLWRGRTLPFGGARLLLTDFRLLVAAGRHSDEIALCDIAAVQRSSSFLDRLLRRSTLTISPVSLRRPPLVVRHVRRGEQLAALLELLATESAAAIDPASVQAALSATPWRDQAAAARVRDSVAVAGVVVALIFGVVSGLHGKTPTVVYPDDDAIAPRGVKRDREAIVAFMETTVMPWARGALAPIVGGADRVTCQTCHGPSAEAGGWQMPGVSALPKPDIVDRGWEVYNTSLDSQMRNAIYGYTAESDNQTRAKYMREVVMPGMAALLHRPAYDFTQSYEYNRTHAAFGCYHCHNAD
jgi:hypothetical protein